MCCEGTANNVSHLTCAWGGMGRRVARHLRARWSIVAYRSRSAPHCRLQTGAR